MLTGKHGAIGMNEPNFQIGETVQCPRANGTYQQSTLVYTDAVKPRAVVPDQARLDRVLEQVQAVKDLRDGDGIDLRPWAERPDA